MGALFQLAKIDQGGKRMFAVATPNENCTWKLFYGTDYHSHLGTEIGGMAVLGHELVRRIHRITQSQFKTEFSPDLHLFNGSMGIGVISPKDEQPLLINPENKTLGFFAICTYGYIDNADKLVASFEKDSIHFECDKDKHGNEVINHTKLVGTLIGLEKDFVTGIEKMFNQIKGSISLMILNPEGIIAARSKFGHTPLYLGQKIDDWAITLETCAFPNLGFKPVKILLPGEIIKLDLKGPRTVIDGGSGDQICAFLPIYTSFPSSEFGDISAETYRERMGAYHARLDLKEDIIAQMVTGLPDSGTAYAIGYANETIRIAQETTMSCLYQLAREDIPLDEVIAKIKHHLFSIVPYRRPIVKYTPGWGRSYTPPEQMIRDLVAQMKLLPIKDIWNGIVDLIMMEDSIVRGTQLMRYLIQLVHIVEELWEMKISRLHVRTGCPPLAWPCKFMLSTRTENELAARKAVMSLENREPTDIIPDLRMREYLDPNSEKYHKMVDWIREEIGAQTLRYPTLESVFTNLGTKKVCTYCLTGKS